MVEGTSTAAATGATGSAVATEERGRPGWHALSTAKGVASEHGSCLESSETRPGRPLLLVSVRSAKEATAALEGGADIIDIKEPAFGPLGMADVAVIGGVIACVAGRVPVSAALGEVSDWLSDSTGASLRSTPATPLDSCGLRVATGSASAFPVLPSELSFAKLGLAGVGSRSDWISDWMQVRAAFEAAAGSQLPWVAVAYADADAADAPPVEEVIAAAARTGCCGVLVDTWNKSSGSLLRVRNPVELQEWRSQTRGLGLFFAVAGKLRATDLRQRCIRSAEVVGVRSAACGEGDRRHAIIAERVATLATCLRTVRATLLPN